MNQFITDLTMFGIPSVGVLISLMLIESKNSKTRLKGVKALVGCCVLLAIVFLTR